jgi:DNA polymerase sigma
MKEGVIMKFRYNDIGKEFTREELDKQDFIDNAIMKLINKVNPTTVKIKYDGHIVSKVREALIEIFTDDLDLCTERAFYP